VEKLMHCVVSTLNDYRRSTYAKTAGLLRAVRSGSYSPFTQTIAAGTLLLLVQNTIVLPPMHHAALPTALETQNPLTMPTESVSFLAATAPDKFNSHIWLQARQTLAVPAATPSRQARFTFAVVDEAAKPVKSTFNGTGSGESNLRFNVHFPTLAQQNQKTEWTDSVLFTNKNLATWLTSSQFSFGPENTPTRSPQQTASNKFVIMLDPGHGGSDPGSIGHNGLQEKTLTLDIAKRASRLLADLDHVEVLLTRNADFGMSRKNRVEKVKRSKANMVVSLHLNHLPQRNINLVETYYAAPHNIQESIEKQKTERRNGLIPTRTVRHRNFDFTKGSATLANIMQRHVFNEVTQSNPDTDNAGVKQDTLYILTRSFTPGVLIELSCLSHPAEAELLASPQYRDRLAAALADGIRDYLATPAAKGFFDQGV